MHPHLKKIKDELTQNSVLCHHLSMPQPGLITYCSPIQSCLSCILGSANAICYSSYLKQRCSEVPLDIISSDDFSFFDCGLYRIRTDLIVLRDRQTATPSSPIDLLLLSFYRIPFFDKDWIRTNDLPFLVL